MLPSSRCGRYARCLILSQIHKVVRAVGVLVLLAMIAGAIFIYLSPSHEFACDLMRQIESDRTGEDYWCLVP